MFNVFINDIFLFVNKTKICNYTDDTSIYACNTDLNTIIKNLVELTHANPTYAHIRYKDGRESKVSLTDLAPCPRDTLNAEDATVGNHEDNVAEAGQSDTDNISTPIIENDDDNIAESVQEPRRSTRLRKKPERYGIQVDE